MISTSSQEILVSDLEFDSQNPRLPTTTKKGNTEVFKYMIAEGKVTDLMQSLAEQGYFNGEPLLAIPSSKKGRFIVVEGNRRLAALKLLNDPSLAPIKKTSIEEIVSEAKIIPEAVPVIVYPKRDDVLEYLGYRHITGVDDWDPLAKARYLRQVAQKYSKLKFEERLKILAKLIGSRADYVKKLLVGFALYEEIQDNDFYGIPNLDEESLGFSLLTTAVSYKNIADYVGLDEDTFAGNLKGIKKPNLEKLTRWVFNKDSEGYTRLGESRNLKILSAVVANPKALKAFDTGKSLDVARLYTSEPVETFSELITISLNRLKDARELLYKVENPNANILESIKEIQGIARAFVSDLEKKIAGDDES